MVLLALLCFFKFRLRRVTFCQEQFLFFSVILSVAKNLNERRNRFFAALRMTGRAGRAGGSAPHGAGKCEKAFLEKRKKKVSK